MVSALASHQIDFSRQIYRQTFGANIRYILKVTLGKPPDDAFVQEVLVAQGAAFCELIKAQLHPLPGVVETLAYFKECGISQAIASSSADFIIQAVLDEIGVRDYFDAIVSGAQLPSKPNPEIFLHTASALQVPARACLVIEDSPAGIEGAQYAGMYSLAISTTYPASELELADMIVDSFCSNPICQDSRLF